MCCSQIVWRHESGDEILSATTSKTVKIPGKRTFETVSVLRLAAAGAAGAAARRVVCEVTSNLAPAPPAGRHLRACAAAAQGAAQVSRAWHSS